MVVHRYVLPSQWPLTMSDLANQADSVFSGISTFGRLPYWPCLIDDSEKYDIAFIGTHPPYLIRHANNDPDTQEHLLTPQPPIVQEHASVPMA